jgi:hypothetical protein
VRAGRNAHLGGTSRGARARACSINASRSTSRPGSPTAATIPTYRHEPKVHVNYQETVLRIKDGLPKMRDLPKEMGGSGETLPE